MSAQLIAEAEERVVRAAVQWHQPESLPIPNAPGVKCDAYLAVTIDSDRPQVLTYIYETGQWTRGEGDTQRIKRWGHIVPVDWHTERDQLRAEVERLTGVKETLKHNWSVTNTRAERAEAELNAANLGWKLSTRAHKLCIMELYREREKVRVLRECLRKVLEPESHRIGTMYQEARAALVATAQPQSETTP